MINCCVVLSGIYVENMIRGIRKICVASEGAKLYKIQLKME